MDAYGDLEPGLGKYAAARVWEVNLMRELRIVDEEQYISIPVMTRARMIAAQIGPEMNKVLDQDRFYKEMRAKQRQGASDAD